MEHNIKVDLIEKGLKDVKGIELVQDIMLLGAI
jgi:hypothetical protein